MRSETFHTPLKKLSPFSRSYILNRGWIDRSAKRLPTYTEVTSVRNHKKNSEGEGSEDEDGAAADPSGNSSESEIDGPDNLIEDPEEFDDVADVFESSYNFRFEEPYVISSCPLGGD